MVEMGDLLAQMEILQQGRAPAAGLQGVVGVGESQALRGGQVLPGLGPRVEVPGLPRWCCRSGSCAWARFDRAGGAVAWLLQSWVV